MMLRQIDQCRMRLKDPFMDFVVIYNDGSFSKVLSMVDIKSKTKFQEMSVGFNGRELIVESAPILLENGNVVEEKYKFVRDKDFGLIKIIGQTKLLQVA